MEGEKNYFSDISSEAYPDIAKKYAEEQKAILERYKAKTVERAGGEPDKVEVPVAHVEASTETPQEPATIPQAQEIEKLEAELDNANHEGDIVGVLNAIDELDQIKPSEPETQIETDKEPEAIKSRADELREEIETLRQSLKTGLVSPEILEREIKDREEEIAKLEKKNVGNTQNNIVSFVPSNQEQQPNDSHTEESSFSQRSKEFAERLSSKAAQFMSGLYDSAVSKAEDMIEKSVYLGRANVAYNQALANWHERKMTKLYGIIEGVNGRISIAEEDLDSKRKQLADLRDAGVTDTEELENIIKAKELRISDLRSKADEAKVKGESRLEKRKAFMGRRDETATKFMQILEEKLAPAEEKIAAIKSQLETLDSQIVEMETLHKKWSDEIERWKKDRTSVSWKLRNQNYDEAAVKSINERQTAMIEEREKLMKEQKKKSKEAREKTVNELAKLIRKISSKRGDYDLFMRAYMTTDSSGMLNYRKGNWFAKQ